MGGEGTGGSVNLFTGSGFETNTTEGWINRGSTVSASTAFPHSGTYSLLVTKGGTDNWRGADFNVLGIAQPGVSYAITVWAALSPDTPAADTLRLSWEVVGTSCAGSQYNWLKNTTANAPGAWVKLEATLSVPADCVATLSKVYVEGPEANVSFYIDDVTMYEE
jgi:hypothetical protein